MKNLRIKQSCFAGLVLLLFFSAGCGKKTKVELPSPKPAAMVKQKQPSPPNTPKTIAQTKTAPTASSETPIKEPAKPVAETALSAGPSIRIGLTNSAKELRISSSGEFYILEKKPEAERQSMQGEIFIRVEQESEESSTIYRIQVASFKKEQMALDLKEELADSFSMPAIIHENEEAGLIQVRIGEFTERDEAQDFLKKKIRKRFKDAFIVKDTAAIKSGKMILALRGKDTFLLSPAGFMIAPDSAGNYLALDGKRYRGLFDISLNSNNRITIVNQLGTEEYLLGVVPAEMSPDSYPELAALSAQAIAARTYALHNMGQYKSEGYDLTADTRSQVYGGVAAERDATSKAVRQTQGIAIYYHDKLINAMYMSTCGGRTEDFSSVFDADPVPYLKSVVCSVESDESGATIVEAKHELEQSITNDDGSLANRNLEFAKILGIMSKDAELTAEFLSGPANQKECVSWIENARKLVRKDKAGEIKPGDRDLTARSGFLQFAAESLFGIDEIKRKISTRDAGYYINNLEDGGSVPEEARYAIAFLMQGNLWHPSPDNAIRSKATIRRGDALSLLMRWVESQQPDVLRKGVFVGKGSSDEPAIKIKWSSRTQEFPLSKKLLLFRRDEDRTTPVSSLRIIGNEKLRFHVDPHGTIDLLEVELNPTGASSDRYSPVAKWDVTISRQTLIEKLRPLTAKIGTFLDMKPSRLGNSGRAIQIELIGSRGSALVRGYKVREALGLKDTLFTVEREYNPDGSIAGFIFHGRGWGHGIGLCQVGAFGMARSGRSYEEILKAYYQGVEIKKAY